jgi:hypothetical protein
MMSIIIIVVGKMNEKSIHSNSKRVLEYLQVASHGEAGAINLKEIKDNLDLSYSEVKASLNELIKRGGVRYRKCLPGENIFDFDYYWIT